MQSATIPRRTLTPAAALALLRPRAGVGLALTGVLLLSAVLNLWALSAQGYGNTYYAATVKSMLTSWHAFFYGAFDAPGFVTVDKPPVGLWVQAAFAKLFGFHGVVLMLPQALAGVGSVALLYVLVRRAAGPVAGLIAALILALSPISVVVSRNNTMDSQLVFVLLLAAWCVLRAAEHGRLRWLFIGAALVGVGFNIKMLQAYLVLPGLWLAYLLAAPLRRHVRVAHLALATLVLLTVSFSWAVAVDLVPADSRPYIGSSGDNSVLSLAFGYNGFGRLTASLAEHLPVLRLLGLSVDLQQMPGFAPGLGDPGPARLLNGSVAAQASWLLPLALLGLVEAARAIRPGRRLDARQTLIVLWGGWLLVCAAYFSTARFYHLYYLVMLPPAVAALSGIGLVTMWRDYRRGSRWGWLLPVALVATALLQLRVLDSYPDWHNRLQPWILGGSVAAAAMLAMLRLRPGFFPRVALLSGAVGLLALLAVPSVWSAVSVRDGNGGAWLPEAGPSARFAGPGGVRQGLGGFTPRNAAPSARAAPSAITAQRVAPGGAPFPGGASPSGGNVGQPRGGFGGGSGAMTFAGENWNPLDPALVRYLEANQGDATYLVATTTSSYASVFMLATDQPALALGGYQGWDRIVTPDRLAAMVADGTVRFFYLPASGARQGAGNARAGGPGAVAGQDATADLVAWVQNTCTAVTAQQWGSATATGPARTGTPTRQPTGGGSLQLYDCAPSTNSGV